MMILATLFVTYFFGFASAQSLVKDDCQCYAVDGILQLSCAIRSVLVNITPCESEKEQLFKVTLKDDGELTSSNVDQLVKIGMKSKSVTELDLIASEPISIQEGALAGLKSTYLLNVTIEGFDIPQLSSGILNGIPRHINTLIFYNNKIETIEEGAISNFTYLEHVNLASNRLRILPFAFLTKLRSELDTLNLANNNLLFLDFIWLSDVRFSNIQLDVTDNFIDVQQMINVLSDRIPGDKQITLSVSRNCFCCKSKKKVNNLQLIDYNWKKCKTRSQCSSGDRGDTKNMEDSSINIECDNEHDPRDYVWGALLGLCILLLIIIVLICCLDIIESWFQNRALNRQGMNRL